MMELMKKNIHMNRQKGNAVSQITLDDDFIVPDTMDDVAQVILATGEVQVESSKNPGRPGPDCAGKPGVSDVLYRQELSGGLQAAGGAQCRSRRPSTSRSWTRHDYAQVFMERWRT